MMAPDSVHHHASSRIRPPPIPALPVSTPAAKLNIIADDIAAGEPKASYWDRLVIVWGELPDWMQASLAGLGIGTILSTGLIAWWVLK